MNVQTRYDTLINGAITDVQTTMNVDEAPANSIGYLTIERGSASEEDVKYLGVVGLGLTGLLRGLSKTALTDTEVAGNKKAHLDNKSVEGTILHYILNNKPDLDDDETVTGIWVFADDKARSTTNAAPSNALSFTNKKYVDDTFLPNTYLDIDPLMAADSDTKIPSQKAVRAYVAAAAVSFPQPLATAISDVTATAAEVNQLDGLSFIDSHTIYTPAYLTGGNSATSNFLLWGALTDGSFRCTIDGTLRDITGINTVGTASMAEVAAAIQVAIRAITSGLETCTWSVNHFVVTSGNTTASSAITELSAAGSGTDISGVAAGDPNMDGDVGPGTVTNKVLNPAADVGKIHLLNAEGNIDKDLINDFDAKGDLKAGTGSGTGTILSVGGNGSVLQGDSSTPSGLAYGKPLPEMAYVNSYTCPADSNENVVATLSIPAARLGATGALRFKVAPYTNGDGTLSITVKCKIGTTAYSNTSITDNKIYMVNTIVKNTNAAAQTGFVETYDVPLGTFNFAASSTGTENTSGAVTATITMQKAAGKGALNAGAFIASIEYINC